METIDQTKNNNSELENKNELTDSGSQKYWLSLDQWRNDPEFKKAAENEFLSSPLSEGVGKEDSEAGGWARREFLKIMGASMALSTVGCLRRPVQKIVPYVNRPEELVLGLPNYYSSSFSDGNEGFGLIVKTREGRPIKVEGLPENPSNKGGLSARAHAHVLNLYDPERLTSAMEKAGDSHKAIEWEKLDSKVVAQLRKGKVAVLRSSSHSQTEESLFDQFAKTFGAQNFTYDGADYGGITAAQKALYGKSVMPRYRLDKADYILSVGADFLGAYITPTDYNRQFANRRKLNQKMNKLVVLEGLMSLTGANADERHQVRTSGYAHQLLAILNEIIGVKGRSPYGRDKKLREQLGAYASQDSFVKEIAQSLWDNRGQSLVLAGGVHGAQDTNLQIIAQFLNHILGNDGRTIDTKHAAKNSFNGSLSELSRLKEKMMSGSVKTLIIHDLNPVYLLPKSFGFAEALKKVNTVIYTGDRADETGSIANIIAPTHHAMENWGDAEYINGVYSVQQPTIRPLYKTRGFQDSLLTWASSAGNGELSNYSTWYEYLKAYWKNHQYAKNRGVSFGRKDFEDFWLELLQIGVFDTSKGLNRNNATRNMSDSAFKRVLSNTPAKSTEVPFELELYYTSGLREGTLANVSWLQEFPDPVTKVCWDNYVTVSPKTAHDMHLEEGDYVNLSASGESMKVPVHVQPGQHPNMLGIALGYGHTLAGKVADGKGVKASDFAIYKDDGMKYAGFSATVARSEGSKTLANMQGHHSMEGRQIVVEATLEQFKKDPAANIHKHKIFSLWGKHDYPGIKWGMSIDLNSCTGCGSCMIACQAENNIPVVGEKYITEGRIMHWIRVDRYYTGTPEDPAAVHMPVTCQHCDNAPCETVCPVAATTHNEEGINEMTYNRCVGTRYCANNCPYKVRRFNWFDNTGVEKPLNKAMNPEVTVRDRGVMEKCTFCSSRIEQKKMQAKNEGRELKDGEVQTACQQSCPTKAISFGNTNDKNSEVSQSNKEKRSYKLLEELNAAPAIKYLTKVRNTDVIKGASTEGHGSSKGGH